MLRPVEGPVLAFASNRPPVIPPAPFAVKLPINVVYPALAPPPRSKNAYCPLNTDLLPPVPHVPSEMVKVKLSVAVGLSADVAVIVGVRSASVVGTVVGGV